jgi:hypothetical protein
MDATTESGSTKRPDKERDQQNLNQIMPTLFPELSKHADTTGDTKPANALIKAFGDSLSYDLDMVRMGPRVPPPPPPGTPDPEEEQRQAELEFKQQEMFADREEHDQEMEQDREEHGQKLRHKQEEHEQQIRMKKTQARLARLGGPNGNGKKANASV